MSTIFSAVSAGTSSDILLDSGGSNDNFSGGNGDGGGGSGNGGNDNKDEGGPGENDSDKGGDAKKVGMSMSQKLTLGMLPWLELVVLYSSNKPSFGIVLRPWSIVFSPRSDGFSL